MARPGATEEDDGKQSMRNVDSKTWRCAGMCKIVLIPLHMYRQSGCCELVDHFLEEC